MTDATCDRISINNLTKIYSDRLSGDVIAFRNISLSVRKGEFVCLLGPSGCGKSTLLMAIAGFEHPTSGAITIDGRPITGPGHDRGIVFQEYALFPWRTVRQNVRYGLEIQRLSAAERNKRTDRFLRMVGLDSFANHYPFQLSGGMKQRVAIARSLAVDPSILLMDEPFGALDAFTRSGLQRETERIWEATQKTIIFVTHAVQEACVLADRIVVFAARPGGIKGQVINDLPRPRSVTTQKFTALEAEVLAMLGEDAATDVRDVGH